MTFTCPVLRISINFRADDGTEITKSVVEYFLVHLRI